MDISFKAEEPFLFAGAWCHDLLQRPPVPFISSTTDTTKSKEHTNLSQKSQIKPILTTFHLFPTLPIDLRLEIWQLCHPPPRNVIISFPQNRRTRARTWDWDKQWIFPSLPYSQFVTLLINHESRDFFLSHYQLIFADFPSDEVKKKEGRKAGWYFNPKKDSLCFGDGVRGLRWFMTTFPEEAIWSRLRYMDVDVDRCAFHTQKSADQPMGYFARELGSTLVLAKMSELRLVTMRVLVVRPDQWRNRMNGYWRPWENTGEMLKQWLSGRNDGRVVKLAMQYIWTEGFGTAAGTVAVGAHITSKQGHEAFLANYPGVLSDDVRRRWIEMGIFLQDGGNKTHQVYDTVKEIFCRNLVVNLN
ncbi:hypothetical protein N431DRAFT_450218 [Stipitochalara longipes BDJ]|nr:hypothetical protein N431DRAFT_450218 [Stipitochalara longipes BDJ]